MPYKPHWPFGTKVRAIRDERDNDGNLIVRAGNIYTVHKHDDDGTVQMQGVVHPRHTEVLYWLDEDIFDDLRITVGSIVRVLDCGSIRALREYEENGDMLTVSEVSYNDRGSLNYISFEELRLPKNHYCFANDWFQIIEVGTLCAGDTEFSHMYDEAAYWG